MEIKIEPTITVLNNFINKKIDSTHEQKCNSKTLL